MKKLIVGAAIAISMLSFFNCKDNKDAVNQSITKEITFTKNGELKLLKAETDSVVARLDIEIADNDYKVQTGLMYRRSMEPQQAMLFVFKDQQPRSFYMKNTEIPLDIIYFNADKELVSVQKNARPNDLTSLPSGAPAQYVLEVNAGLSDIWELTKGDRFEFSTTP